MDNLKVINQDMLTLEEGLLFHQVNCKGIMGGGIAYALAQEFPGLEKAYQEFCRKELESRTGYPPTRVLLGKVFVFKVNPRLYIINVFGQDEVSTRDRMTSYDATAEAFELIAAQLFNTKISDLPLYFPYKMGCGLGGGDWTIYSAIIEAYFPDAIICRHDVR